MKKPILIGLFASATACATPAIYTSSITERTAKQEIIESHIETWLNEYDVPAVAIAYIENGALAWSSVGGEQSADIAATQDTLFNIASMTKSMTAETVLRLAAANEISLTEPMSAHWVDPDIADDPRHNLLTPEIALRHRTGFPNWRPDDESGLAFQFEPDSKRLFRGRV